MAQTTVKMTGLNTVRRNLRREISKIRGNVNRGIQIALAWLLNKVIKITPLEFGFLRNSGFTDTKQTGKSITGRIGFTIDYAPFVHEKTDANFRTPNTQAKFLEKPIMENSNRILEIIRDKAKIK